MPIPSSTAAQDRLTAPAPAPAAFRGTARTVGVIYLAGMVLGIGGNLLILSILGATDPLTSVATSSALLALGVVFWLVTVAGDAAHGILMFPVLKPHGERMAMAYFGARIIDAILVTVMTLLIACQIPLSNANAAAAPADAALLEALSRVLHQAEIYAYEFGMIALGVSGLILCMVLRRSRLLPSALASWGLVGYAILLTGSLLEVLGLELNTIHTIPGGLWEVFIGVWLITKGFNTAAPTTVDPNKSPPPTSR